MRLIRPRAPSALRLGNDPVHGITVNCVLHTSAKPNHPLTHSYREICRARVALEVIPVPNDVGPSVPRVNPRDGIGLSISAHHQALEGLRLRRTRGRTAPVVGSVTHDESASQACPCRWDNSSHPFSDPRDSFSIQCCFSRPFVVRASTCKSASRHGFERLGPCR